MNDMKDTNCGCCSSKLKELERQIAGDLLSIGAVFLRPEQPFTWASGIKSPIYCDNRLTLTAPAVRNNVENGLATVIRELYPECEVLMGTSTAGIAHAAITATILDKPMGYVRGSAKVTAVPTRLRAVSNPVRKWSLSRTSSPRATAASR